MITVDSVNLRLKEDIRGPVDLDRSCRGGPSRDHQSQLVCFRIYYMMGPPSGERVGVVKFVPEANVRGSKVEWEESNQMLQRATTWALNPVC